MIAAASWRRGRRRGLALMAVPALVGVAGVALMVAELSFRLTNPPGYTHPGPAIGLTSIGEGIGTDPLIDFGLPFQDVAFPTAGQAVLRGWLVPGRNGDALEWSRRTVAAPTGATSYVTCRSFTNWACPYFSSTTVSTAAATVTGGG